MEMVEDGGGRLSVVLAGHPKLRNDLHRPAMEEIGYRTDIFTLYGKSWPPTVPDAALPRPETAPAGRDHR